MREIMEPTEECMISGQHIWLDGDEVACLSTPAATLVTDAQAQTWVDKNYPGREWRWGF